jgi:hypothetical protein
VIQGPDAGRSLMWWRMRTLSARGALDDVGWMLTPSSPGQKASDAVVLRLPFFGLAWWKKAAGER